MPGHRWILLLTFIFTAAVAVTAQGTQTQTFASSAKQTTLLELYTAEGCSSCPPADAWLSEYTRSDKLWRRIVPVAFHVTYWDQYGWTDRYAKTGYTERQRDYARHWHDGMAYTPNFVRNGLDWKLWFRHPRPSPIEPRAVEADAGPLEVTRDGARVKARYSPPDALTQTPELHVAVLAFGLSQAVNAGENSGRKLHHDFVVVGHSHQALSDSNGSYTATIDLPEVEDVQASRYALAAWVSNPADMQTLQATGGWLATPPG